MIILYRINDYIHLAQKGRFHNVAVFCMSITNS